MRRCRGARAATQLVRTGTRQGLRSQCPPPLLPPTNTRAHPADKRRTSPLLTCPASPPSHQPGTHLHIRHTHAEGGPALPAPGPTLVDDGGGSFGSILRFRSQVCAPPGVQRSGKRESSRPFQPARAQSETPETRRVSRRACVACCPRRSPSFLSSLLHGCRSEEIVHARLDPVFAR